MILVHFHKRKCRRPAIPLVELSVVRIIRHGYPHGYPYRYPCNGSKGEDIRMDVRALKPFTWISMRMSVSNYPYYGRFDQGRNFDLTGKQNTLVACSNFDKQISVWNSESTNREKAMNFYKQGKTGKQPKILLDYEEVCWLMTKFWF